LKKLKIFNELELPILQRTRFISSTANCIIVTRNCNANYSLYSSNTENCAQNMVGREGWIWNFRWVQII